VAYSYNAGAHTQHYVLVIKQTVVPDSRVVADGRQQSHTYVTLHPEPLNLQHANFTIRIK